MPNFTGQLNSNEVFAAIYNMIISQQVFSDNINGMGDSLVDKSRVDGTLYGDTRLYYATDVLKSYAFEGDDEAENLLALARPDAPEVQAITINVFRQIRITVDNYLTKRGFGTEGAFAQFNSVILGWLRDTKNVYDFTLYNAYIGTTESSTGKQELSIPLSDITATGEEKNRLEAQTIAKYLADLFTSLTKDVSRDYNDYGNLRKMDMSDIRIVWNSKYVNRITKLDLPTIFHNDALIEKFADNILPARYFGQVNTSGGTTASSNTTIRALVEKDYGNKHLFPGDLLPNATQYLANETYTEEGDVICKIMHNDSVPYMSGFEVATNFFNPRSLTETHFLTFGHNTLEYLKNYPFITVHAE